MVTPSGGFGPAYVGCMQSLSAMWRGQGWAWVDGTPAANLNCGVGGDGCGLWHLNKPDDNGCRGDEGACQNYCVLNSGLLDDFEWASASSSFICELDLVPGALLWIEKPCVA